MDIHIPSGGSSSLFVGDQMAFPMVPLWSAARAAQRTAPEQLQAPQRRHIVLRLLRLLWSVVECCAEFICCSIHFPFMAIAALLLLIFLLHNYSILSLQRSVELRVNDDGHGPDFMQLCLSGTVLASPQGSVSYRALQLASAWALANKFDLVLLMPKGIAQPLETGFQDVGVPTVQEYLAAMPECARRLPEERVLALESRWHGEEHVAAAARAGPVVLPVWFLNTTALAPVIHKFRELLQIKSQVREYAQTTLHSFRQIVEEVDSASDDEFVYIGVYARRSQIPKYVLNIWNVTDLPTNDFYSRALRMLLPQLVAIRLNGTEYNRLTPVVFVVIVFSDDIPWVQDVLKPDFENMELNDGWLMDYQIRVFPAPTGDVESFGDLTLLASCNHTVISYGMLDILAAILADGKTIAFNVDVPDYPSVAFAGKVPEWYIMK